MKKDNTEILILAGGRGKRLRPFTDRIPKPLLPVKGKPFLEILIDYFKNQGFKNFILSTGYKSKVIENYFKKGKDLGVSLEYSRERRALGTGGALKKAGKFFKGEDIIVSNGDSFIDLDLKKMLKFHNKMEQPITIAVTKVKDSKRSGQLEIKKGIVNNFQEKGKNKKGYINAGVYVFKKDILKDFPEGKVSLEKEIFPKFLGKISAFESKGYFVDIGVKEDYRKFKKEAVITNKDLKKRKAVFLDRDGVVNKDRGYVHKLEDFFLERKALQGLRAVNPEYTLFFISNQSGIARGYYTEDDFELFDFEVRNILREKGIKVSKTYYCPHHPKGRVKKFRKNCNCRKPNPGLFLKAEKEFGISLKDSFLVGDKTSDILAGKKAGCRTILVKTGYKGEDKLYSVEPDFVVKDLLEAAKIVNTV